MEEVKIDFSPFFKVTDRTELCMKLLSQINTAIKTNNLIIQRKIDNPYTPCEQNIHCISNLLVQLRGQMVILEVERKDYNKKLQLQNQSLIV